MLHLSLFSSTQIIVNSFQIPRQQHSKKTALANSPVLDYLLPKLSIWQTGEVRKREILKNIDAHMLEETRVILERVRALCTHLALADSTRFNIKLPTQLASSKLFITGEFEEKQQLVTLINQDNWLFGAFEWLCPNYTALAHSQELNTFSYLYEKNRQQALHQYRHFSQTSQGMRCYLACHIEQGEPKLTWRIESPKTVYILKELQS